MIPNIFEKRPALQGEDFRGRKYQLETIFTSLPRMEAFSVSVALLPYGCLLVKADDPAEQVTERLLDAICGFVVFLCSNALLVTKRSGSLVAAFSVISAVVAQV
jgi:hypothetical protein